MKEIWSRSVRNWPCWPGTLSPFVQTKVARSALSSGLYNYDMVRSKTLTGYCGPEASHQWLRLLVRLKRNAGNAILNALERQGINRKSWPPPPPPPRLTVPTQICSLCNSVYSVQCVGWSVQLQVKLYVHMHCVVHCAVCSVLPATGENLEVEIRYTRRYGPLLGPTSSSCGGLKPSARALLFCFGPF